MDDPLGQLLRDADASVRLPVAVVGLAQRVRAVRNRKRRVAQVGAAAVVLVAASAMWTVISWKNRVVPTLTVSHPSPQTILAQLAIDLDVHARTAELLMQPSRSRRVVAHPMTVSNDVQLQRDRAALILVYEADRSARENRPGDAIASYRRAIELFPQTHWAEVARRRLRQMQT